VVLLDASAILAFIWQEPGASSVEAALIGGDAACTITNWSEVAQKLLARGGDWPATERALGGLGLVLTPVDPADAVAAARLWLSHPALSLADRLCLAVGTRLGATILSADRAWAEVSDLVQVLRPPAAADES